MQNKTIQHKHRALYAIKRSNKAVKIKRNDKRLYNNDKTNAIMFSQSQIYIVFSHNN